MWLDLVKQLTHDNVISWDLLESYRIRGVSSSDETDYLNACKLLLTKIDKNSFLNDQNEKLFDSLFLKKSLQTLQVLTTSLLTIKEECYRRDKILDIIQKFLYRKAHLAAAFRKVCLKPQQNTTNFEKEDLINSIVNLPSHISNVYQLKTPSLLLCKPYYSKILDAIRQTFVVIHSRLTNSRDSYIEFLAGLVGKISSSGYADLTYKILLNDIISRGDKNFVWRRILRRLIELQSDREIEFLVRPILYNSESTSQVRWIFTGLLESRKKLQYLFTEKFFLINYLDKDAFLVNLISFLANESKNLFQLTFYSVLQAWCDERALKHRSFDQQMYLCSALVIFSNYLNDSFIGDNRSNLISKLVPNIEVYLKCAEIDVRLPGLYVAKVLLAVIQTSEIDLKLEIEEITPVRRLMNLKQSLSTQKVEETDVLVSNLEYVKSDNEMREMVTGDDEEDDMDDGEDDLEPYDMPNDVKIDKTAKPIYLTDCINGLLDRENPDYMKVCLESCAELIEKNGKMTEDYAENLCRALLHLEDVFELPQFLENRQNSLITLCLTCPVITANYLTTEFYKKNVLMSVKMDILEIITMVSARMSDESISEESNIAEKVLPQDLLIAEKKWRDVIEERIKAKTRKFTALKMPKSKMNPFPKYAGYFFFPLAHNYIKSDISINFAGDDYYLLGRLIFTLGVILECVSQAPIARKMGQDLLGLLWSVKFHIESFVRKAVIFCFCIVLTSVPPVHLMEHMQHELSEFQKWLIDVANKDLDKECVSRAFTALFLLKTLAEEHKKLDWNKAQDLKPKLSN